MGRLASTVGGEWLHALDAAVAKIDQVSWPNPKWAKDPVGFATHILGVQPWGFQIKVLERLAAGGRHTAISGGRKIGKDWIGAVAALWWFASFEEARVHCFGPTQRQIDEILWRQIRFLWLGHGKCIACKRKHPDAPAPCPHSAIMPGKLGLTSKTGLRAPDMRQIIGMTSASAGGVIGMSGRILAIEDEAARMKDEIDEAIVGNLAASGCARLAISNPTRTSGFFWALFHHQRPLCDGDAGLFMVSSETSPNISERKIVHKDLASLEWLAERERAWGRGSAPWTWHVEGRFLAKGQGSLFSVDEITDAEIRWDDAEQGTVEGRLALGIDVAGDGYEGDETAYAVRRGDRIEEIVARKGQTADAIVQCAAGMIARWDRSGDREDWRPKIIVDRDGETGARVYDALVAHSRNNSDCWEVVGFRGSPRVLGNLGESFHRNRDLLFGTFRSWLAEGGQIPQDIQLEAELIMLRWKDAEAAGKGKQVLMPKSDMREILQGRSPDRADACALSTWGEIRAKVAVEEPPQQARDYYDSEIGRGRAADPYRGVGLRGGGYQGSRR
jgi:hypothetical protein